ncbi:hypothetical protein vseg_014378 [Gypsophila vaccaria]
MDFPDLDELQWLESNAHLHDHPLDDDEEEFYAEEFNLETTKHTDHQIQLNSPPHRDNNSKKRSRSPTPEIELDFESSGRAARVRIDHNVVDLRNIEVEVEEDSKYLSRFTSEIDSSDTGARVAIDHNVDEIQVEDDVVEVEDEKKYLSRFASEIEGECMPITAPSGGGGGGERVYAKIEKRVLKGVDDVSVGRVKSSFQSSGLISESVGALLQKAEQDALLKALRDSSEVQDIIAPQESSVVTEQLWVNKYAPRSFTELLSDEQTNREVLLWLKHWDSKVFGATIRNTEDEVLSALKRHSSVPHHQKHSDSASFNRKSRGSTFGKNYMGQSYTVEHTDTRFKGHELPLNKKQLGSGPPEQKILLLCGPPGLGKTTLAHVAAKHCGYHVSEINASDDRSSTILETKILDAVQMNSIMADSKPKCLIIDEIDGALGDGKGAVEILLKMIASDTKSRGGKEGSTAGEPHGKKSLNKKRSSVSMSRPVICICNDLYAPSLRSLRQVAKVHVFAKPTISRVVSRLKYICNKEGLKTSSISLTALAEITECDIRACLNTLQFLHKKKESLNLGALDSQVIGRKDITRSVFDVWKEVFQTRKVKASSKCAESPLKAHEAHGSLYSLVSFRGDYELILDGIHENYLQMHYHDPLLQKTTHCLDALGASDVLQQNVMRSHNMFLYAYFPPIIITIHQLLARVERPTIEWPKSFQRYRTSLMEKMETLRSWQSKIGPSFSRHLSVDSFVSDTVSPLLHILAPVDLRPVALHLLSNKENNDLNQLVSTMVSYSLTFKNAKPDPLTNFSTHDEKMDASQLSLDPPIQSFICYKDYKSGHYELRAAVKQVVVHEVEMQKIVRGNASRFTDSTDSSRQQSDAVSKKSNESLESKNATSAYISKEITNKPLQNNVSKPNPPGCSSPAGADAEKTKSGGGVKKASASSFNFFDRFRKSEKGVKNGDIPAQKLATAERDGRPLVFKFNEGYTNAVKRPVRIREFLS